MKAFILAAGYGKRMQPLTHTTPKPLLNVGGKPLIQYHIERLQQAGITDIVINTAYLGEQIEATLGDGSRFGVAIEYSREGTPLETGGAINHALPLLGDSPFLLVNGDIYTDYPFQQLLHWQPDVAHLVLVPKPGFKAQGDFDLVPSNCINGTNTDSLSNTDVADYGQLINAEQASYTYAGLGIYNPEYFINKQRIETENWHKQSLNQFEKNSSQPEKNTSKSYALGSVLRQEADNQRITAEVYTGEWVDVGTPERLAQLDDSLT